MATGPTGYKFYNNGALVDFYDVFQSGTGTQTTGFKISNGVDLGNLFVSGNSGIVTNYKNSLGTDLGSLFDIVSPFIATGAYGTGITANYYYAIFTDTSNLTKAISPNSLFIYPSTGITLNFICVGGGGGGGGASSGESCGGGGGGGVFLKPFASFNFASQPYSITVGAGSAGGQQGEPGTGGTGGDSQVLQSSSNAVKCTGGIGGNHTASGVGGQVFTNNSTTALSQGNGGNGGDRNSGVNSYYNNSTTNSILLSVPDELINNLNYVGFFSKYYGGGGGGGYEDSIFDSWTGGQGGGTDSIDPNTGLGGARGTSGSSISDGFPGNGYGSGGGAGGGNASQRRAGGAGRQGIVICYATRLPSSAQLMYYYQCEPDPQTTQALYDTVSGTFNAPFVGNDTSIVTTTTVPQTGTASLSIPNSSSYVNMQNILNFNSGSGIYSLATWFRTTSTNNIVQIAVFSSSNTGFSNSTMIRLGNGMGVINEYVDVNGVGYGGNVTATGSLNFKNGDWYHLVWSGFGNSTSRDIYINGALVGTISNANSALQVNATGTTSRLGSSSWATTESLTGNLDNIQIYRGRLTQSQVTAIYNKATV